MFSALYATFFTFILHIKHWFSSLAFPFHHSPSPSHLKHNNRNDPEASPSTPIRPFTTHTPPVPEMTLALPPPALTIRDTNNTQAGGKTRPVPMAIKTTLFDRAGAFPVIPRTPGRLSPNPAATLSARSHPSASVSSASHGNLTPGLDSGYKHDVNTATPLSATGNSVLLDAHAAALRSPRSPREELGLHRPVSRSGSRFCEGGVFEGVKL